MLKADLHLHSYRSPDSGMKPDSIIRVCLQRKINCIALTDHNTMGAVRELQRLAPFTVIAGEEIKTSRGEIIGLFLQEEIGRGMSPEKTVEEIKSQGGVVYVPHPFDRARKGAIERGALLEIIDLVDVIETHNSRITFPGDRVAAERFALEHGKSSGGGSDAHVSLELGNSYVEMSEFEGPGGFLASISQGKVYGKLSSPLVHFASAFARWQKKRTRAGGTGDRG